MRSTIIVVTALAGAGSSMAGAQGKSLSAARKTEQAIVVTFHPRQTLRLLLASAHSFAYIIRARGLGGRGLAQAGARKVRAPWNHGAG